MRYGSQPYSRKRKIYVIFALAVIAVFSLLKINLINKAAHSIGSVFSKTGSSTGKSLLSFACGRDLVFENDHLRNLLKESAIEKENYYTLQNEYSSIVSQCKFLSKSSINGVTSSIYSRSSQADLSNTVFAEAGIQQGITTDHVAIIDDGIVAGKVDAVADFGSRINLLTHKETKFAATIISSNKTLGIVEGNGTPLLHMRFIPENAPISVNDLVITSGLEENVPYGLVIGVVNSINSDPEKPFKEATIEPLSDMRYETIVTLILNKQGI
ncbi:MAG: hypothetical protein ACD_76C00106G0034 [uncultured bacterium]|nr:MAG: hypothetical protein ACD_76C00106G0034 [uncultured bacterium]